MSGNLYFQQSAGGKAAEADRRNEKLPGILPGNESGSGQKRERRNRSFREEEQIDLVLREMAEYLSCGITNFSNGLNPQKVIIGYDGYWVPDMYLRLAEEAANGRLLTRRYRRIQVMKSHFKADGTVFGCAGALLTAIFEGKLFE